MVRATGVAPTVQQNVDGVWDEDVSSTHTTVGTAGSRLEAAYDRITGILADYARRTPFTYGPTNLAAGATFVPAAGTVVTIAALDSVAADDFKIVHGTVVVLTSGDGADGNALLSGYVGMLYCDGTNVGIKNADSAGRDLVIEGITI